MILTQHIQVTVIAVMVSIIFIVIYRTASNQEKLIELTGQYLSAKTQCRVTNDYDNKMYHNKVALLNSLETFKYRMWPSLLSFIPIIFIMLWVQGQYDTWLLNYIVSVIVSSIIIRKFVRVY